MANYQNSDMKKAEDVFVIKQPHHKEEDFGSFWGYGGIYSKSFSAKISLSEAISIPLKILPGKLFLNQLQADFIELGLMQ